MADKKIKKIIIGDGQGNKHSHDFTTNKIEFVDALPADVEPKTIYAVFTDPNDDPPLPNDSEVNDATDKVKGISKLSDAINSNLKAADGKTAATPFAVKRAYDKAKEAYDLAQQGGGGGGFYILTPKITTPIDGTTDASTILTISGTAFKSVFPDDVRKHRTFQVSKQSDFSTLDREHDVDADELKFSDQLDPQTTYYIRIKDVTEDMQSAWSSVVSITTGDGIKVDTPTITILGEPNRIGRMPIIATSEFTVTGGTDTHKSTTWVIEDKDTQSEVYKSENDTVNKTSITVPTGKLEWDKSYVVKVFHTGNTYGNSNTAAKEFKVMVQPDKGDIGVAGQAGFGVGIAPQDRADACDLELMANGDNPLHENYGNYQLKSNPKSISVYIPPFWVRVGESSSPRYAKYGLNCVDYKPFNEFSTEAEANAQNYFMPEGFFNKDEIVGFFFDKYICSEENGKYYSIEGAVPKGNIQSKEMLSKCKTRGNKWNAETIQQVAVLRFISLIQAQYCTSTTNCAWWDGNDVMNFPKGNNNKGVDKDDTSVHSTGNNFDNVRTGSCTPREKTTHNGQKNGICDVNGTFCEWAWGVTNPNTFYTYDDIYILKRSVDFAKITFGLNGEFDAFGDEQHLLTLYNKTQTGLSITNNFDTFWGNNANQVLRPYNKDGSHGLCCIMPKNQAATSASGTNLFGKDRFYKDNNNNSVPWWSGFYSNATQAGIFQTMFDFSYNDYLQWIGVRAAAYGN